MMSRTQIAKLLFALARLGAEAIRSHGDGAAKFVDSATLKMQSQRRIEAERARRRRR